jgi:phospholipid-binding lipoprotein MlaA
VFAVSILAGCAGQQAAEREPPSPDPFEPFNRAMYKVNEIGDRYLAKPVAKGYEKATPRAMRLGASHFLDNLRYPITIINDFLQGKVGQGGADLARLALNSTVGLFGLFDPATEIGLDANDEDFGQTFAVWGLPEGPYLVVPLFGPYTVSSLLGDLVGTQVSPLVQIPEDAAAWALWAWYLVDTRYRLLGIDEEIQRAFDPYVFVRDSYLQNRRYRIHDGQVPEDELMPDDEPESATP